MADRFFTEDELRDMERRTVDRLTDAIDAGDSEKAKKIAKRMYNEFLGMHDLYRNWITATLSEVARRHGDEAEGEAFYRAYPAVLSPEDIAQTILSVLALPQHINVDSLVVRPTGDKG